MAERGLEGIGMGGWEVLRSAECGKICLMYRAVRCEEIGLEG